MKNYEVGIIVGVIALIGYFWYKNSGGTPSQQPIGGNVISVSTVGVPLKPGITSCMVTPGGLSLLQPTTMISCNSQLVETP